MLTMDGKTCLRVVNFIEENKGKKAAKKLKEKLEYLDRYGDDHGTTVRLFAYKGTDWDITFNLRSGKQIYGGLVFNPNNESWGVHT